MKRTHFFHGILLIVLILSFMACKDDHGPIYLISATDHQQITDGKLEINLFSKGEKFLIRGGEGNYTIKNENEEIVDIVRGLSISLEELPLVLQQLRGGTSGQSVQKSEDGGPRKVE